MMHPNKFNLLIAFWVLQLSVAAGFTDYLLKTCAQSGFCHRNREYARNIQSSKSSYYSVDQQTVQYDKVNRVVRANIIKNIPKPDGADVSINLPFTMMLLDDDSFRFTIDEIRPNISDLSEDLSSKRYNGTSDWAFVNDSALGFQQVTLRRSWFHNDVITLKNSAETIKIELHTKTFLLKVFHGGHLSLIINERALLNIEHYRKKEDNYCNLLPEESSFNMFGDNFEYSRKDTIPFGPESVALDFSFKDYQNAYGIPEHADSLRLRDTSERDPYRLFNVDVFEYNLQATTPMYGSIPLLIVSRPQSSVGLFWVNAADTWVDIKYDGDDTKSHWMSESGIIDVVLFFGQEPSDITNKYTALTGRPTLPLLSSIGYHQCRWNYNDEQDVLKVDSEMDRAHIPYDFIWLDLEYTDDKKFFTWKPDSFPHPRRMLGRLASLGRQLAVLIDPHLKKGYGVSNFIIEKGAAVKDHEGKTFIGHCWPGKSVWIDTLGTLGQNIWGSFFKKFVKGVSNLHIWNDMNEPSIFSGPETTAPKDLIHSGGTEERSVHNLYGMTVHQSTYEALRDAHSEQDLRPFILTRSFFAGSQRSAATWTGDNVANWDYLKISVPMCLTNNIAGLPFIGADIAGFSGDPEAELIARWYQAGLWYPFFRGHAHIDTKRREPYLFSEPLQSIVRDAIQLRYRLLPTLYSSFQKASIDGTPIMKPMFYEKPHFLELYDIDDQFYLGDSGLLVKPVLEKGQTEVEITLPPGKYYQYPNLESLVVDSADVGVNKLDAPIDRIPILLEGGHIIFSKEKYRRSSRLLCNDAYTLTVAPSKSQNAFGRIYVDDGETFGYERGEYLEAEVRLISGHAIKNTPTHVPTNHRSIGSTLIEKIVLPVGSMVLKEVVKLHIGNRVFDLAVSRDGPDIVAISNPRVRLDEKWEIIL